LFSIFYYVKNGNTGMPEYRKKLKSGIVSFAAKPPRQSGIGIPALASVRYRWSRIIPAVPSYEFNILPVS
jgi:hypothetical protein